MFELSELLNKPAICKQGCRCAGYVSDGLFDLAAGRLAYLKIGEMLLPFESIFAARDAVITDNFAQLKSFADVDVTMYVGIIGKNAYTAGGSLIGVVDKAYVTKTGKLAKLTAKGKEITPTAIEDVGDFIMLKSGAMRKKSKNGADLPRPDKDYEVEMFNNVMTAKAFDKNANVDNIVDFSAQDENAKLESDDIGMPNDNSILQDDGNLAPYAHKKENVIGNSDISEKRDAASAEENPEKIEYDDGQAVSPEQGEISFDENSQETGVKKDNSSEKNDIVEQGVENMNGNNAYGILPAAIAAAQAAVSLGEGTVFSETAFNRLLDGDALFIEEDAHTPTRIICDYDFLLGRTLAKDLNTYAGELIAAKGSEVTKSVVEKARWAGKLVELTLNSVKKQKEEE